MGDLSLDPHRSRMGSHPLPNGLMAGVRDLIVISNANGPLSLPVAGENLVTGKEL